MWCIPFLLEVAAVLATFVHPNHIVYLCSWGLTHLPPTCNSKLFRYFAAGFQLKQYLVIHPVSFSFGLNRFSTKGKKI
ncbi:hypothetical protein DLR69_16385 [Vibrio paracholerae]|uniref:Secreted protein n=1 Tax=Vibrio paracholerae TaxID=650003 RepID=A0AAX1QUL5_9VIBR|nr:hypothetical protein DLR69_16385 [Vibrio paracholerae]RBM83340.1 hypothetical protein DLR70_06310 [Vibrio paracholerae]